ncbi:MAG TPA: ribonuclease HII [Actinobacteria bacterium]|nr:ribonuclease HII [Actinomycetota bacterium]
MDPYKASLSELKEALVKYKGRRFDSLLETLEQDPRVGAKKMAKSQRNKIKRSRDEDARLLRMMKFERMLEKQGYKLIAGADEVGRGALAGPLVAASVILKTREKIPRINDSKKLTSGLREELSSIIKERAVAWAIAEISHTEIDENGLQAANLKALRDAVDRLTIKPDYIISDGFKFQAGNLPVMALIKGDTLSQTVAAASIIAKVHRDELMTALHEEYPNYGFSGNKGYGSAGHIKAVKKDGACPFHRVSFLTTVEMSMNQIELEI